EDMRTSSVMRCYYRKKPSETLGVWEFFRNTLESMTRQRGRRRRACALSRQGVFLLASLEDQVHRRAVFFVVFLLSALCFGQKAPAPQKTIAIRAATLIDGTSAQPRHNVVIVIRGNKIQSVGEGAAPADAEVIDLGSGSTVLPGLIDAHTHMFLQGEDPAEGGYDVQLLKHPSSYRAARAVVAVHRALEQGFTTLRDVETEGAGYGDVGIKEAIND